MKNILRNFWVTLTRFKMASMFNILGLSIAFAVFTVIMIQSYWEFTYNKSIPDNERIVRIETNFVGYDAPEIARPYGDVLGEKSTHATDFGIYWPLDKRNVVTISASGEQKRNQVVCDFIDSGFLSLFGIECLEGSLQDFERPDVSIINQSTARLLFGDESALGKQIIVGDTVTVSAVIADFPDNCMFKNGIYANIGNTGKGNRSNWNYHYYFKVATPDNFESLRQQFVEISKDYFGDERQADKMDEIISIRPLNDIYFSSGGGNFMLTYTLIGIAVLIVCIAVINFINFFMALVPIRIRSVNINKIFGTSVAALRVNIVCETVGIVLVAFAFSLLLVHLAANSWFSEYVVASLQVADNMGVVAIVGGVALLIGLLAGLYPSWYITKFNPMMVISGSFGRSKSGQRVRATLITFQYVISIALIIAAMFIQLQTNYMRDRDMGFNRDRLLIVDVGNKIAAQPQAFLDILKQDASIEGVSYSAWKIVDVKMGWGRKINGVEKYFSCLPVRWDYPEFMGIELVEGRYFREDDANKASGTMLVNQTMARRYGVKVGDFINGHDGDAEVVGIVKDFNFTSLKNSVEPVCLYEFGSNGWYLPTMANIRISPTADLASVTQTISSAIKQLVPTATDDVIKISPFDHSVEALYASEQKLSSVISIFSLVAIIIALVGVFGLVVFEVQYRRKEVALRKVMGATVMSIPLLISRRFIMVTVVSAVLAIPLGYIGVWVWLQEFAFRISLYWWIAGVSFLIVMVVTLVIVWALTLKAATENPVESLKFE